MMVSTGTETTKADHKLLGRQGQISLSVIRAKLLMWTGMTAQQSVAIPPIRRSLKH